MMAVLARYCGWVLLLMTASTAVLAAEGDVAVMSMSRLLQVIFSLVFIVGLIFVLAAVFRRSDMLPDRNRRLISVLGSVALGNREKLLLIQVGEEQILISQAAGEIRKLHKLSSRVEVPEKPLAQSAGGFADLFRQLLDKKSV